VSSDASELELKIIDGRVAPDITYVDERKLLRWDFR
jgi:hypothetical protein